MGTLFGGVSVTLGGRGGNRDEPSPQVGTKSPVPFVSICYC